MPLYVYLCRDCGQETQQLVRSISGAQPLERCGECGGAHIERTLTTAAYHRSFQTRLEQLDPRVEREIAAKDYLQPGQDRLDRLNMDFAGRPDKAEGDLADRAGRSAHRQ